MTPDTPAQLWAGFFIFKPLYKKAGFKKNPAKTNGGIDKENPKRDFNVLDYDSIF